MPGAEIKLAAFFGAAGKANPTPAYSRHVRVIGGRHKAIAVSLVVWGCLLSTTPALAWNAHGHMTMAVIAYKKLDPPVREKVDALLKLNPSYPEWVAQVPEAKRPLIAFMRAANWAEAIRRDGVHVNDSDSSAPDARRNIGYDDNLVHPYWHYINLPLSPDGTALKAPVEPNVKTQIAAFRSALASPRTSDNVKSYDLVWLLHLVGDVHQPLHAVSRFDRDTAWRSRRQRCRDLRSFMPGKSAPLLGRRAWYGERSGVRPQGRERSAKS